MHNLQWIIPFNIVQLTNLNSQYNCLLCVKSGRAKCGGGKEERDVFVYLQCLSDRNVQYVLSGSFCQRYWIPILQQVEVQSLGDIFSYLFPFFFFSVKMKWSLTSRSWPIILCFFSVFAFVKEMGDFLCGSKYLVTYFHFSIYDIVIQFIL